MCRWISIATTDVLVLRRALARGESIARRRRDRAVRVAARAWPRRSCRESEDLGGRLTRRPIPEGTAVTADALDAALLIHRGQSVTLAARAGGLGSPRPGSAPGRCRRANSACGSRTSIH